LGRPPGADNKNDFYKNGERCMRKIKHLPMYLSVVAAGFGLSYQAQAQQKIAEGVGNLSVEEIIVTARKTEESIQDIPFSIQAVNDQQIQERDMRGLDDIVRTTPGVTFESFSSGGASSNVVVRGLTNTFTTARVQNVSTFLNGIYLQRQGMINPGLLDMQRVEILKGPQSALFGRNAFAGAINYITSEPSDVFGGKVGVTIGDDMRRDYKGSITGTIVENLVYGKFSYINSSYDGHTKNDHFAAGADPTGFNSQHDLGGWDNESFSTGLRFTPRKDLTIGLDWFHTDLAQESQPYYTLRGARAAAFGLTAENPNTTGELMVPGPYIGAETNCNPVSLTFNPAASVFYSGTGNSIYCGKLPSSDPGSPGRVLVDPRSSGTLAKTDVVSFDIDWEINDDWLFTYQYGYTHHTARTNGGADGYEGAWLFNSFGGPGSRAHVTSWNGNPLADLNSQSHEIRFEWSGNDLVSGSFGVFYSNVKDEDWALFLFTEPCDPGNPAGCNIQVNENTPYASSLVPSAVNGRQIYQNGKRTGYSQYEDNIYSAFGTLAFTLADDWTLRLEGRYTEEQKRVDFIADTFGLAYQESVTIAGTPITSTLNYPSQSDRFYFFAPRAALEWQVTPDNLLFFTVAKGEKTGGFNNTPDPAQAVYDPETNWTYELGSKNTFLDNSVVLNGSLYYVEWEDIQGAVSSTAGGFTTNPIGNIGGGENMGLELDGLWNIATNWAVDGGFSVSDPKFDDAVFQDGISTRGWSCQAAAGVCDPTGNVDGNQLQRTSKKQAFWGLTYRTVVLEGWGLSARIDGSYQSRQYVDPLQLAYVPARTLYNANLTLQAPNNWEFTLWGKNIFDKDYASSAFSIAQFNQYVVSLGAGESYGLTATYTFE
jgi:iron complex outermembrane receptor protein